MHEALRYHEATKHSPISIRMSAHTLDFNNKPTPYKLYRNLPQVPLPCPEPDALPGGTLNLAALGRLLQNANGITRILQRQGRELVFRAAACTGALYEIELYVVCAPMAGLLAGVYHYSPLSHALETLRSGDYRALLAQASAQHPSVVQAPLTIIATGTYWRNAWKYQARTYRHLGWDNGTITANLLATASALQLPCQVLCGFVDESVRHLLALDGEKEVALTIVPIGTGADIPLTVPDCPPRRFETGPLSPRGDVDYPIMRKLHTAAMLETEEQVASWRTLLPAIAEPPLSGDLSIDQVIARRGSTRRFDRNRSLSQEQLMLLLQRSSAALATDFGRLNALYVIANAVDGLPTGAYHWHEGRLDTLKRGDFRAEAGFLDLEQDLAADAAVNVYFMANLDSVVQQYGERGYRAVQLEAGILGGRMYLAAYALGFGATGLTFFDDEVTAFFSPHAAGQSPIFLMAFGHKDRS